MKKLLLIAAVVCFATASFAQEQGDMRVSAGMGQFFDPSTTGFGGGFEYVFADAMSGNVSFYSYDGGSVIAVDYRYYFMTDGTGVYANAGYTSFESEGGLNIGAGAVFGISDNLGIGAALKYELLKIPEVTVTATSITVEEKALGLNAQVGIVYTF